MNLSQKRFKTHNFKWTFNSLKSIKIIKEKLNRKELVNRLNHTNSKLKGVGLLSIDESQENLLKTLPKILLKVRRIIWKIFKIFLCVLNLFCDKFIFYMSCVF